MAKPHDPEWRWRVGLTEYRKHLNGMHKSCEEIERENHVSNPLDMWQAESAMVAYFYNYGRSKGFDNMVVPNDVYFVVASKLTWKFDFDVTWRNVMEKMNQLRREFFYFRELLDFPGIHLAEDKKHLVTGPEYYAELNGEEECWLFKRFRLYGFDYYKEMRFIVINKKIGGISMECGLHDWYYIKGRNSDVGEEVIRVNDYDLDAL